ncbi:MAG: hypothetical protein OQK12_13250 [Motiliproteus sp.]|nr:hypothetical protein [Motiliproteus sp.]MCW9054128.1 hypothetical protein [Motiliproteus sp.]
MDRIIYLGLGSKYTLRNFLGANRWKLSGRFDYYLDVSYSAHDLHEDANERSGDLNGHEWEIKASGEYSTPWSSLYLSPYAEFKEERLDFWHDDLRDKDQEAEKERQYEAGLFLDWVSPLPGWDLTVGGYWQKERDAEKNPGETEWQWEDEERWIGKLKLEYEAPWPGFELELGYEEHLNGVDEGEKEFNLELSYEF